MLKAIKELLSKVFALESAHSNYKNEVEQFIISKNPTSAAEVDYWLRVYDHKQPGKWGY